MKLFIIFILTGLVLFCGYKLGSFHEAKRQNENIKGMHQRYLQVNPFEGDDSYETFDHIFGHQDDEFYPNNTTYGED